MFNDKEKFIQAITIFAISDDARKISASERQNILDYIRRIHCTSIMDSDWGDIAREVNENRIWILEAIKDYKNPPPVKSSEPEPEKVDDITPEPADAVEPVELTDDDSEQSSEPKTKKRFNFSFGKKDKKQNSESKKTIRDMFNKKKQ